MSTNRPGPMNTEARALAIALKLQHDDPDRAAEARAGGWLLTHLPHTRQWSPETVRDTARLPTNTSSRPVPVSVAEEMTGWPVYRAGVIAQIRDTIDSTGRSTMRGLTSEQLDQIDELGSRLF